MPTVPPVAALAAAHAQLTRLAETGTAAAQALADPAQHARLLRLALVSDFALDTLQRQPELIAALDAPAPPPVLPADDDATWPALLRRWRAAESTRLVWRDVGGIDRVEATLAGSSWIAEQCLQAGLRALEGQFVSRHGTVRAADGTPQRLIVFGLGKLGGGELNFSSDIDLVFAYAGAGSSDGPRMLAAEDYFARLGQHLIRLLDDVTADGFCHRVDMRLRPFGKSGRLVLSAAAMEQYFQREGRDWERYAWLKARPVAGDITAGDAVLETLRPFVYRRYLDYGALDGLREMKALITAEVERRELADDVKLGPGGIREIEFLAQALQLIRGGREPALRQRALLAALAALTTAGHLQPDTSARLVAAYRFLRRLENRLQMLGDQQRHALPADPAIRARLAAGLDYADWDALAVELAGHRRAVSAEFARLLAPERGAAPASGIADYWRLLPEGGDPQTLAAAGFDDPIAADASLREFAQSAAMRGLSARGRARLDRVLPALLDSTGASPAAAPALPRLLALLHAIARRTSYLALLDEQPAALRRLVDLTARSALMADRLVAHPLLLDELLDVRAAGPALDVQAIEDAIARAIARTPEDDTESVMQALNEVRQSLSFRVALSALSARQSASETTRQLAWLAQALLRRVLLLAETQMRATHGAMAGGLAVIGYGSLGGCELGFGSDLDLVFLYDAPADAVSAGPRPLDAARWYARLAQKLVNLLGTASQAGRLYEVDVRLRPDGAGGLLVSSLASFADYQRERAWTWERQALVRARPIAGDARIGDAFEQVRRDALAHAREDAALRDDVVTMRRKMRAALDRSRPGGFDLKHGDGGLVDLEFLLQARVLACAATHPALCAPRRTPELIAALGAVAALENDEVAVLLDAHELLLARALECTLDRRPRITVDDVVLDTARAVVHASCVRHGLVFRVPDAA